MAKSGPSKTRIGLTAQEEAFCQHYALNQIGAAAYLHAFPKASKWKPATVHQHASRLLAQGKIQARLMQLKNKVQEIAEKKFEVTTTRVLQELAAIAFANAEDYFEWGTRDVFKRDRKTGNLMVNEKGEPIKIGEEPYAIIKPSKKLTREQKAAITGVSQGYAQNGMATMDVKMGDKIAALKTIGTHLGMFNGKTVVEHTGKNGGPIETKATTVFEIGEGMQPKDALRVFEEFRRSGLGRTMGNA